jgi:hypothetical protein
MPRPDGIKPTYIDIPEDLKRAIKSEAALRGSNFRGAVLEALGVWLRSPQEISEDSPAVALCREIVGDQPEGEEFIVSVLTVLRSGDSISLLQQICQRFAAMEALLREAVDTGRADGIIAHAGEAVDEAQAVVEDSRRLRERIAKDRARSGGAGGQGREYPVIVK